MTDRSFTRDEVLEIANRLQKYDGIFNQLWQIGHQTFDSSLPTAAVSFDEVGQVICLMMNPVFWQKQSSVQKDFVICHEMLHVILEHGRRAVDAASQNRDACNVAMDVVVNELLVKGFGFHRKDIDPKNKLCWLDTVFKKRPEVLPEQTFEYYLNQLPKTFSCKVGGPGVLDDHSKLGTGDVGPLADRMASKMSQEEKDALAAKLGEEGKESNNKQAGNEAGGFVKSMGIVAVPRKRKWETLVKKYLKQMAGMGMEETWITAHNRRLSAMNSGKIILPTEVEMDGPEQRRALVYMFLDTSGSCAHLAPRFWRLCRSVPRDVFDLRLRCFDTRVYQVNFKDKKLYGFGGTSFHILENHIQQEIQGGKYPDGVFCVTDGYGSNVRPAKPEKWHVLLTPMHSISCFPNTVHFHNLGDFE